MQQLQQFLNIEIKESGPDFHFQDICERMSKWFDYKKSSEIWSLPYRLKEWTDYKAEQAFEICKKKNIKSVKYFIGIILKIK